MLWNFAFVGCDERSMTKVFQERQSMRVNETMRDVSQRGVDGLLGLAHRCKRQL